MYRAFVFISWFAVLSFVVVHPTHGVWDIDVPGTASHMQPRSPIECEGTGEFPNSAFLFQFKWNLTIGVFEQFGWTDAGESTATSVIEPDEFDDWVTTAFPNDGEAYPVGTFKLRLDVGETSGVDSVTFSVIPP